LLRVLEIHEEESAAVVRMEPGISSTRWLLGEIAAARRDPPEHADGHYRDALALAEELGMRPLVAHCQLGLGKLYRRIGKREQTREHLTTATTLYRDIDMRFWLEQAEAEVGA
jgi:sugar phosphate isomerase/epimerase